MKSKDNHDKNVNQTNLKNMSTEQLKTFLHKIEHEHDCLQAKNEELNIQISDLRNAVKCVEGQRKDTVDFELQKKKQLVNKINSLEKGLKYSIKNSQLSAMESYKALMQ